jgi:hypothetical protein
LSFLPFQLSLHGFAGYSEQVKSKFYINTVPLSSLLVSAGDIFLSNAYSGVANNPMKALHMWIIYG